MRRNRITRALALFTGVVVASAGIAHADNVSNDVGASGVKTITAGEETVINYHIHATGGSCDAADGSSATVTVNETAGVSVSTRSLNFQTCGVGQPVTFASTTAGDYLITVSVADTAGRYNTTPAAFTLKVNPAPTPPANTAPSVPDKPAISEGVSPNNTGMFSLSWAASTDAEGNPITYTVERRNSAAGATFTPVASSITPNSHVFAADNAESEGTWVYRVKASDGSLSSNYSDSSDPVVVDMTAPNAPVAAASSTASFTDAAGGNWWRGSVSVGFTTPNGDPALADGSAGSGVNASTLAGPQSFSTTGLHSGSGTVKDHAGNLSAAGTLPVWVDADAPTASFTNCPTNPVAMGSSHTVNWTAEDVGSGLATAGSGSVPLDTTSVGPKIVPGPAPADNVGNTGTAPSCSYSVVYSSTGVLQPINSNGSSVFKIKSTIPVKIQLTGDSAGTPNGKFTISLSKLAGTIWGTDDESVISTSAHSGTTMRYDSSADQYIFNFGTSKITAGTYRVTVTLDDGTIRTAEFGLRS